MESNLHTSSVIARLMGLDEPSPPQPAYKQRRLLSENYLRKTASIGLQEKSSFSSTKTKKHKGTKASFAFTEEHNISRISGEEMQIDGDVKQKDLVQKGIYDSRESDNLIRGNKQFDVFKSSCASIHKNDEQCKKSDRVSKENILRSIREEENGFISAPVDRLNAQSGYAGCKKNKQESHTSFNLHSYSNPLDSRALPRSNTLQIHTSVSGNSKRDDDRNRNKCTKQTQKRYIELGDRRVVIPEKKSASRFYKHNPRLASRRNFAGLEAKINAEVNTENIGVSFMNLDNLCSEPSSCSLITGDDLSSCSWETSVRQESLNDLDPINSKGINQSSPNSVLEPHFKQGKLLSSECFESPAIDLHSVVKQLKFIETNSEGTYSEGSEMAVSSIGSTDKRSSNVSRELMGVYTTEESRDFSYLVDVLDEACLNFEVNIETCYSLESPINPMLFEALEKKYGKQISWSKPERRLLFDRINSLLSEILESFTDVHIRAKSLKMRFNPTLKRSEIEEELWRLLVSEEEEVGKELSEKVLGGETKWLKTEREISVICEDVESYLFDELAAELYRV